MTTTPTTPRELRRSIQAERNAAALANTILFMHSEAHRLIDKLTQMVDAVDPESASWGDAGSLAYYVERLREMTGEVG